LPASPAYEAEKENFYAFDLDKAQSLLAEAGVTGLNIDWIFVETRRQRWSSLRRSTE
jgi:hypothetical protein